AAFWQSRASLASVTTEEKRGIAFRSLEAGEKSVAEKILQELARNEPPEGPDVAQLLFVWGPRPKSDQLNWIEARARAASEPERQGWMEHLVNLGAARR